MLLLFVYGSLQPGQAAFAERLAGRCRVVGAASVAGQLWHLVTEGYPALTVGEAGSGRVHGVVLELNGAETLAACDDWEDFALARPAATNDYQRVRTWATLAEGGAVIEVWAYVILPESLATRTAVLLPGGRWPQ